MKPRLRKLLWIGPAAIVGMAVFIAIGGGIVMALWNWLLPPLFGWREVTFWQAIGLLALCRILFGGLGHGSRGPRRYKGERFKDMTPEERDRLRQALRDGAGLGPAASESPGH